MKCRTCRVCGINKNILEFYEEWRSSKDGKLHQYHRYDCKQCNKLKTKKYQQNNKDRIILIQSKSTDKIRGLSNDLTIEVVRELLNKPCFYCNENNNIGLDRMNNDIGHTISNVTSCCIRCNAMKRDMPIEAWLFLVPSIKKAKDMGLFGDWVCHNRGNTNLSKIKAPAAIRRQTKKKLLIERTKRSHVYSL